jgi:hypothetical protein
VAARTAVKIGAGLNNVLHGKLLCSIENGRVKSRPDPPRFPHLTRPFWFFRKKPGAGRVTGRIVAGAGSKTEEPLSRRNSRDPVFDLDEPGFNPDLTQIFSAHLDFTRVITSPFLPMQRTSASRCSSSDRVHGGAQARGMELTAWC